MSLASGSRLGPYEILSALGTGGMGEVYRAWDPRLKRDIAIKVLPETTAGDPERRARLEREAQSIAGLSHPSIVTIYSVEELGDVLCLTMEFVDGKPLSDLIVKGGLPLTQILNIVIPLADAISAAHQKGITHRDLKPANVMFGVDGRVKVLDFGLAKLMDAPSVGVGVTGLATGPLTVEGHIMGTVAYMSPEQAEGKPVDHRSDIFSLGVMLYELATGERPFTGETSVSILSSIIKDTPRPLTDLKPSLPRELSRIVKRCLVKDPDDRYQNVKDLRNDLRELQQDTSSSDLSVSTSGSREDTEHPIAVSPPHRTMRIVAMSALGLLAIVLVGLLPQFSPWLRPPAAARPVHLSVVLPERDVLDLGNFQRGLAISPDGQSLIYAVGQEETPRLDRRSLSDGQLTTVGDSVDGINPFFSPDGQWLAFFKNVSTSAARGPTLWKMSIGGGVPQAVCDLSIGLGGSWADDNSIIFANFLQSANSGLWRVPAGGGRCEPLTTLEKDEGSHAWPDILPGGKAVIYTVEVSGQPFDNARIVVRPLPSGQPRVLIDGGYSAKYVRSGHLVFGRANRLMAVPFDAGRLAITGPEVTMVEGISDDPSVGALRYAVSDDGTLAYVAGGGSRAQRSLMWLDRAGAAQRAADVGRLFGQARLSPDGSQIAVQIHAADEDVWLFDTNRSTLTRLTSEGENFNPIWAPDGRHVIFTSSRGGTFKLFQIATDGSSGIEQLTANYSGDGSISVSPDGKIVAFQQTDPSTGSDIWMMRLDGDRTPRSIVRSTFSEANPRIAPDGHRIAYQSNESGRFEIYVQAFPGPGPRQQVSVNGGISPMWARNGRELFFIQGDTLMATNVALGETFSAGKPHPLFAVGKYVLNYDVSPDGRFLMIERSEEETSTRRIEVVLNWFTELQQRAHTR